LGRREYHGWFLPPMVSNEFAPVAQMDRAPAF
jgi:hypothetical protein